MVGAPDRIWMPSRRPACSDAPVTIDLTYLSIGILMGFGVLAVLAGTVFLLDRSSRTDGARAAQ